MKILLLDTRSGQYLTTLGGWTPMPGEAANFVTPRRAWSAAKSDTVSDLVMVIHFPFVNRVTSKFKRAYGNVVL